MATLPAMIRLPEMERLRDADRTHIQRFLATGIAQGLKEDPAATWTLMAWPHIDGFPARFILRSNTFEELEVTFQDAVHYTTCSKGAPAGIKPRMSDVTV